MKRITKTIVAASLILATLNACFGTEDDELTTTDLAVLWALVTLSNNLDAACGKTQASAIELSIGSSVEASVQDGNWCYYKFTATATESLTLTLDPGTSDKDLFMSYEDGSVGSTTSSSNWQFSSTNASTANDTITQSTNQNAVRYVGIYDFNGSGGTFTLSLNR